MMYFLAGKVLLSDYWLFFGQGIYEINCASLKFCMLKPWHRVHQNATAFRDWAIQKVTKTQSDWKR